MRCVISVPNHPGGLRKGTNNWLTVHSKGQFTHNAYSFNGTSLFNPLGYVSEDWDTPEFPNQ